MVFWLRYLWNAQRNYFGERQSRLLVYDEHRAQTTQKVKQIFDKEYDTTAALISPWATSKIQPLDVVFNNDFKKSIDRQATEMMAEDPEIFFSSKLSAGKRRILFTKCVGKAWQETFCKLKETVIRSFAKCGIALPTSGGRDEEINLEGLPYYKIGQSFDVEGLVSYTTVATMTQSLSLIRMMTIKGRIFIVCL